MLEIFPKSYKMHNSIAGFFVNSNKNHVLQLIFSVNYRVFTRSSKRPAKLQQMYPKNTWIAGRLLPYVIKELDVCWIM